MHALICGAAPEAGGEDHYRGLLASAAYVVAADAGAEWAAALGRVPDVAVGDFDSAAPGAAARLHALGVDVVTYPAEKDFSDLDLALAEARARGASRVTLTAVSSMRLDHTLAALGVLAGGADLAADLDEPSLAAWAVDAERRPAIVLEGPAGCLLSVFAVGCAAEGVTLENTRYPLSDALLRPLSGHGLSNELAAKRATVTVGKGRLLVLSPGPPDRRARAADAG